MLCEKLEKAKLDRTSWPHFTILVFKRGHFDIFKLQIAPIFKGGPFYTIKLQRKCSFHMSQHMYLFKGGHFDNFRLQITPIFKGVSSHQLEKLLSKSHYYFFFQLPTTVPTINIVCNVWPLMKFDDATWKRFNLFFILYALA